MNWYSVFVRSFADSNGDGIGDLPGLIHKLDYLAELGIEGIWLLPVHPAPSYHKYDVIDYYSIDPEYGTLQDMKTLISEAHKRTIKVILDLVVNHTSELHPWFMRAQQNKRSVYRDFYVWKDARYLPPGEESQWHRPAAGPRSEAYYGIFWKGMPDLNYDHERVRANVIDIARYWLDMGIDGFRLDAAMHIYPPDRNDDNIRWWQEFRKALDKTHPHHYLVGEVTESCAFIGPYLRKGLHACFNFELAEHIIQAINYGRHDCLVSWLMSVNNYYRDQDPGSRDAMFLSNHDQTRIASRLGGDLQKIKLASSILLTLPGDIYLYYGEELGMLGDKPDEHIREPFLWDKKTAMNHQWITPQHSTPQTIFPLNRQQENPESVFTHYRNWLRYRRSEALFYMGSIQAVECSESSLVIYTIQGDGRTLLVVHNLTEVTTVLHQENNGHRYTLCIAVGSEVVDESGIFNLGPFGSLVVESFIV